MNKLQLSYSSIKDFEILTPNEWKHKWIDRNFPNENNRAFTFGSLLDCVLFEPEVLGKRFLVLKRSLPSDVVCDIIAGVVKYKNEENHVFFVEQELVYYKDKLVEIVKETKYWANRKPEGVADKIIKEHDEYFKALNLISSGNFEASRKKIVSQADVDKCGRIFFSIVENPDLVKYFIGQQGVELYFQQIRKADYLIDLDSVTLKAVYDCIRIDHNNKTIQVVDLKSTAQAYSFNESVKKYRYASQVGVYNWVVEQSLDEYPKYKLLLPINIVVDKQTERISIYEYTQEQLDQERLGDNQIKGWESLIEEIYWHYRNDFWDLPMNLMI